jgi:hypothetical protein
MGASFARTKMADTEAGEMQDRTKEAPMRKLTAGLFVSLDGFATDTNEEMRWVTDDLGEDTTRYGLDQLRGSDVLGLGRVSYEIMAAC